MNSKAGKYNILILAEGYEEKPYLDKILSFPNINHELYCFGPVVNVKGNGNIVGRYQYEIQRDFYDVILIFCDADKGSEQFMDIVHSIGKTFFLSPEDGKKVFIFANPVTLQLVLSHFGDTKLIKVSKAENASEVERLTGIANYHAEQDQIDQIIGKITYSSLEGLKTRLRNLSEDIGTIPSTNFLRFLEWFEGNDDSWIEEIRKARKD